MTSALVVIPTYDERENIPIVVARALAATPPEVHLLVVDDASPDGTGEIADRLAAEHDRVHVLHRAGKEGLGRAYLAGFAWGLENGFDALVEMDADGSHHPEDVPRLLAQLADHDLALGSRWVPGGTVENWPRRRLLLSRGGNWYARVALGIDVRDVTGGFRAFRAEALERIRLADVASHGYCFQVDLAWRALQAGLRVVEIPIVFTERVHGVSKMNQSIVVESLRKVTWWGLRRRVHAAFELLVHHRRLGSVRSNSSRAA
ncbi:polyprenol monophosphomannose synthase [Amnibacterium kyonggiense]|uniref:Dolichol-phosphate mannosyltransferase n=1 Tax=Amnibacterium kyonggiense TaxID=595671 RepID=A0A4R7FIN8_9MICO|nr:polyprenol monophosphomannose synthase [Amnibacterium kyonggiense]TDS74848.1 dolichol-phosphate mannosyltransferase [Amnibacterium kyonggiense]